ncbi:MAG TPA: glycoside hydrolase family 97 catalytic domain-containing protein [Terracidiphilus sp.]|jgi:alpha-glucosidase
MMKDCRLLAAVFCCGLGGVLPAQASDGAISVKSPDGHVEMTLSTESGQLKYQVSFNGHSVLEKAPLDIRAVGDATTSALHFGSAGNYQIDDSYPWYGVHASAQESGTGIRVPLLRANGEEAFDLDARAYNNGIAFRFTLPGQKARVPEETVAFRPVRGSLVWSFDPTRSHYEGVYERSGTKDLPKGRFMAPPVVVELPGDSALLAITEGRLQDYPGMVLQADGEGAFSAQSGNDVPADKALEYFQGRAVAERLAIPASIAGPILTPWRIVMIATTLSDLVNNDIVSDVSDAPSQALFPEGERTSWIRPGRAVWNFLDGGATTLDGSKQMSKKAAELGFEYQEVEGYWTEWSEVQLKELVDYSRSLGVGIWLWRNRKDLETPESRKAFFDLCNRTGVVGVKIDFFDSEAQEVVDLYQTLLRETAEHHLLVNFHGADKPTGEQRTYPNELTREAVEGMEYCCADVGVPDAPRARHAVTIPFTRLLAGPADYTPMLFDKGLNGTTWANQIASAVILTSPLLTLGANPDTILNNPAVDIIRDIPSTWDETLVLPPSRIGELAIFARRKGDTWFLACMNGEHARRVDIPLHFLGAESWNAKVAGDVSGKAAAVTMGQMKVDRKGAVHIELGQGGGYVAEFTQSVRGPRQ